MDTIAQWRRQRNIRLRRPVSRLPAGEPEPDVEADLYEPPGDDVSEGYVSSGCTDSLGSIGDLVERPIDLPDVEGDFGGSDFDL